MRVIFYTFFLIHYIYAFPQEITTTLTNTTTLDNTTLINTTTLDNTTLTNTMTLDNTTSNPIKGRVLNYRNNWSSPPLTYQAQQPLPLDDSYHTFPPFYPTYFYPSPNETTIINSVSSSLPPPPPTTAAITPIVAVAAGTRIQESMVNATKVVEECAWNLMKLFSLDNANFGLLVLQSTLLIMIILGTCAKVCYTRIKNRNIKWEL
nr:hypothetical protein [Microctonus hyperodae filamentous virus]